MELAKERGIDMLKLKELKLKLNNIDYDSNLKPLSLLMKIDKEIKKKLII